MTRNPDLGAIHESGLSSRTEMVDAFGERPEADAGRDDGAADAAPAVQRVVGGTVAEEDECGQQKVDEDKPVLRSPLPARRRGSDASTVSRHSCHSYAAPGRPRLHPDIMRAQRSVTAAMPTSASPPSTCRTSPSEQDTLALLTAGRSPAAFAATLHISEATVKAHVNHLLVEPDVNNRVQLAVLAHGQVWSLKTESNAGVATPSLITNRGRPAAGCGVDDVGSLAGSNTAS